VDTGPSGQVLAECIRLMCVRRDPYTLDDLHLDIECLTALITVSVMTEEDVDALADAGFKSRIPYRYHPTHHPLVGPLLNEYRLRTGIVATVMTARCVGQLEIVLKIPGGVPRAFDIVRRWRGVRDAVDVGGDSVGGERRAATDFVFDVFHERGLDRIAKHPEDRAAVKALLDNVAGALLIIERVEPDDDPVTVETY
jgi:hypothetical protein